MSWSTREVADLAGTTVNTVRHYHRVGLLNQPTRSENGYKLYRVEHLVRLIQILRIRELGVPLDLIDKVGANGTASSSALQSIDSDLAAGIERLQRARAEIASILRGGTTTDVPAGFDSIASDLSPSDRSLVLIYSRLYDDQAMADLRSMLERDPDAANVELNGLPPDADRATRDRLVEELVPGLANDFAMYPWLLNPFARLRKNQRVDREAFLESVRALYNEAQLDVVARASALAITRFDETRTSSPTSSVSAASPRPLSASSSASGCADQ